MQVYPEEHSTVAKKLLSYTGAQKPTLPAGQTPTQDLDDALDNVFRHPNVAPFISVQLIRKLTTSNPSPEYVGRVAAVFNNDGTGQRGNLTAVVRAILTDTEARTAPTTDTGGKLKEPLLRLTQLWRAYDAKAQNGRYDVTNVEGTLGEAPLKSASVFNFFSPSYAPTGEVANRNLVAPEAELATEYLESTTTSYFFDQIYNRNSASTLGPTAIVIDITDELAAADNPDALVSLLANKLLGKPMSAALETEVRATINRIPVTNRKSRATEALFLVATAPEFEALR